MSLNKLKNGRVFLAGAGPGDPGLLTLKTAAILKDADVVIYDRLVNPAVLEIAAHAQKIYAGKSGLREKAGEKHFDQKTISSLLVRHARAGKKVVRLKGGDPFVFGRGGEEAEVLKKAGIPFEVIPGVSAGHAVPAYAGIPVTDRRLASSVTFVTAHEDPEKDPAVDWAAFAKSEGTLVCFMTVKTLPQIVKALMDAGKPCDTPASVIQNGTLSSQKIVEGELWDIVEKVRKAGIGSPALTVIGPVNSLRKNLKWFENKPLAGKKVLVTRSQTQAGTLRKLLEENGAEVLEFPVIRILPPKSFSPLDRALRNLKNFDWFLFVSVNAVDSVFSRVKVLRKDARVFGSCKIAAIGEATRDALAEKGIAADLIPPRFTSDSLFEKLMQARQVKGKIFLLPRTDIAPEGLRRKIEAAGGKVTEVMAYRTVSGIDKNKQARLAEWLGAGIDYVTFTSASSVIHFFKAVSKAQRKQLKSKMITIGPVTSKALHDQGIKIYREAKQHTIPGMVESLIHDAKSR